MGNINDHRFTEAPEKDVNSQRCSHFESLGKMRHEFVRHDLIGCHNKHICDIFYGRKPMS